MSIGEIFRHRKCFISSQLTCQIGIYAICRWLLSSTLIDSALALPWLILSIFGNISIYCRWNFNIFCRARILIEAGFIRPFYKMDQIEDLLDLALETRKTSIVIYRNEDDGSLHRMALRHLTSKCSRSFFIHGRSTAYFVFQTHSTILAAHSLYSSASSKTTLIWKSRIWSTSSRKDSTLTSFLTKFWRTILASIWMESSFSPRMSTNYATSGRVFRIILVVFLMMDFRALTVIFLE